MTIPNIERRIKKIMTRRSLKTMKRGASLLVKMKMMIRRGILKMKQAARSLKKRRRKVPMPVI